MSARPAVDPSALGDRAEHVLLLSLPFGALERPSLGLSLLAAHCTRIGTPCDLEYLAFPFAEAIGLTDYLWICNEISYTAFVGEWLFSQELYGPRPEVDAQYIDEVLRATWGLTDGDISRLLRLREQVAPFLGEQVRRLPHDEHTLVGFTSVFQQNIPSLSFAARVKQARPDITIAFGGANWESPMGEALLDAFPFVDLGFSGEADRSFPDVLQARRAGRPVTSIPGVLHRDRAGWVPGTGSITDLDELPIPDFDRYFAQQRTSAAGMQISPNLPVETARGCWWGARSHCTFCGLNGSTMTFRSKTPSRVVDEFVTLRERHGTRVFGVVDDILDSRYFHSTLPLLAQRKLDVELFWEVKANLSRAQVRALRNAGVVCIQPGIESFSDHVLALMKKGTTGLRNIELLKWCQEYGITPFWNMLYGFPGETADDYRGIRTLIRAIWHLDPPIGYGPIRLDRFSPYHEQPAKYGMTNVRPMDPFRHLYPFDRAVVDRIAYYFDFDYADERDAATYAHDVIPLVEEWRADPQRGALTVGTGSEGRLHIVDTRDNPTLPHWTVLDGWQAAVYLRCDRSQLLATLTALPEAQSAGVTEDTLTDFLRRCVEERSMVHHNGRWLSLAVHTPACEHDDQEVIRQEPSDIR